MKNWNCKGFLQVKTPFEVRHVFQTIYHEISARKIHLCENLKENGVRIIQIKKKSF